MARKETYLNGGLYRNTCQKLNIFVKNVKKNFLHGNAKRGNSARISVDINGCIGQLLRKGKQAKYLIVNIVKKDFMFQAGRQNLIGGNIVQKNVIGKINQEYFQEKEILNILMEEQKNMQKHFIFQKSGEGCEKRFIKEIIGLVRNVKRKGENCMPIIEYQLENAKIHSKNQILLPCVENATQKHIVLNNRQEVQNEFFK